ncbi:MAG: thermonuclease family protein [Alphaproteobacteria bacterium]|nr:thermonuclease family protein [Alphaproteobacteria bacterium]
MVIMSLRAVCAAAAVVVCSSSSWAEAVPRCAGDVEIPDARIMRIEHNDVLVLTDGRALMLEGIRLPNAVQDRAPAAIGDQAFAALIALAKDQELVARAIYPKEDRYDRVRSQVFKSDGTWLQIELLRQGLARVDISPDRSECAAELFAAEAQARAARAGLWALPAYAVRTPDSVKGDIGTFQIVQGVVRSVDVRDQRTYLNFGIDWHSDFTVTIAPDDMKLFRQMGVDPRGYQGKLMRVRGLVQSINGPEMDLASPKQAEVLQ